MVSSSHKRLRGYSNSNNISTYLRHAYLESDHYTTEFFGQDIDVVVTSSRHSVQNWIDRSLYIHRYRLNSQASKTIFGLGTQWRPSEYDPCPATIQICIGHRVLIFQILHSRSNPAALSRLLCDDRITFVGYNIGYDCRLLSSNYGLETTSSTKELRSVSGMATASMENMVERFLGFSGVSKPEWISASNWDAPELSVDQVQYAALDAYLSFQLGVELVARPAIRRREQSYLGSESDRGLSPALSMTATSNWESEPDYLSGSEEWESYSNDSDLTEYGR